MTVIVNGVAYDLAPGMSVRHALIRAGLLTVVEAGARVRDRFGNEVGVDGALGEGMELVVDEAARPRG